ncbi:MAG TPA: hypothetical protein VIE13_00620 [Terriglobales bacterium]|jgi:hypothetical protein
MNVAAVHTDTPAQEAMETPAVTKAQAAKGDPQAIRKLAQENAKNSPSTPAATAHTRPGGLDVHA